MTGSVECEMNSIQLTVILGTVHHFVFFKTMFWKLHLFLSLGIQVHSFGPLIGRCTLGNTSFGLQ
jgi:hypothetical protein